MVSAQTGNEILKAPLTGSDNRKWYAQLASKVSRHEEWPELVRLALSCVIYSQSIPLVVENQLETWGPQVGGSTFLKLDCQVTQREAFRSPEESGPEV